MMKKNGKGQKTQRDTKAHNGRKEASEEIFPQVKRKLSAFLGGESGKISKQSIVTIGSLVGAAAISSSLAAKKAKGTPLTITTSGVPGATATVSGTHSHY